LCAGLFCDRENLLKNKVLIYFVLALAAPLSAAPGSLRAEDFTHVYALDNGSTVRVYTPEGILSEMTRRDASGDLVFYPEGGGYYYLIEDISSPLIVNKGAGEFFPMSEEAVMRALREIGIDGRTVDMKIDVYILPMPRLHYMSSTSAGCRIFLSPGVWEVSASTTATVVTHEFGHCFQKAYLPDGDVEGWEEYLGMRGILDDPLYSESSIHMNRPSELFAEDFRILFGGELAVYPGSIENPYLAQPSDVEGLEEFMASLAGAPVIAVVSPEDDLIESVGNYPNPFNPVTTIRADFNGPVTGRDISVRIYAADGSLVRDLWAGTISQATFEKTWDGMNDTGTRAASGIYFYRITAGPASRTGKMLLVR
jgi:hypothetical protein